MVPMTPDPGGDADQRLTPMTGRALVATPTIGDDRFAHSVILVLEHDAGGALGLVLTEAGDTPVDAVLGGWADRAAAPAVVFAGGPVGTDRALGLVRLEPGWSATPGSDAIVAVPHTAGTVGLVDLSTPPGDLDAMVGVGTVRVFAGYAGWGAGQLDAELGVGAWWDATVGPEDVFTAEPDSLWQRVVARQGGTRSLFARFTGDPSLN